MPLQIGGVVPELLDPGLQDLTIGLMQQASLADVGRITVTWQKGQTAMDPGLLGDLRTGVDKATRRRRRRLPRRLPERQLADAELGRRPGRLRDLDRVGRRRPAEPEARDRRNESNLNLFWLPQFGSAGQDLAAIGYTKLLAKTYDAVKAAAPTVEVLGGALAHSGTDKPSSAATDPLAGAVHPRHGHGIPRARSGRSRSWTRSPTTRTWSAPTCRRPSSTCAGRR